MHLSAPLCTNPGSSVGIRSGMPSAFAVVLLAVPFAFSQTCLQNSPSCDNAVNTSASRQYRGGHGNVGASNVSKVSIRSLLYPGSQTRIYARYMPWFGDPHH